VSARTFKCGSPPAERIVPPAAPVSAPIAAPPTPRDRLPLIPRRRAASSSRLMRQVFFEATTLAFEPHRRVVRIARWANCSRKYEEAVYRTLNTGNTWEMLRSPLEIGIYEIVDTRSHALRAASSRGLLKSEDTGLSLVPVPGALSWGNVSAICKHPTQREQFFASRYGMIFRTRDGGVSWTPFLPANQCIQPIQALVVVARSPDWLFALIQNRGVYRITIAED